MVINMANVFRDLGVSQYIITKADVNAEEIGAALGITLTTSWTLAALLAWFRYDIAAYFK
jgi:hypothetical protein